MLAHLQTVEEAVEQENASTPCQAIAGECDSDVLGAATIAQHPLQTLADSVVTITSL
jgi:hypothetical protein